MVFFSELILALVALVVIYSVFIGSAFALFGTGGMAGETIRWSLLQIAHAFPIWLAGLSICNFLYFCTKGSLATTAYLGLTVGLPFVITHIIAPYWEPAAKIAPYLMFNNIGTSINPGDPMGLAYGLGLGWTAVSLVVGLVLMQKREIK